MVYLAKAAGHASGMLGGAAHSRRGAGQAARRMNLEKGESIATETGAARVAVVTLRAHLVRSS